MHIRVKRLTIITACAAACLLPALTASCNTQGCTENHSAIPRANFCNSTDGNGITLDSVQISGVGAPDDSVLYKAGDRLSSVYLPMRATQTATSWCLSYKWKYLDDPALNDTLTFGYQALPFLAGDECGAMYRYRITHVGHTTHLIDSIGITDSLVTNIDIATINIYFRVSEDAPQQ